MDKEILKLKNGAKIIEAEEYLKDKNHGFTGRHLIRSMEELKKYGAKMYITNIVDIVSSKQELAFTGIVDAREGNVKEILKSLVTTYPLYLEEPIENVFKLYFD